MGSDEDMAVGFQPVLSSNGQRTAEPSGAFTPGRWIVASEVDGGSAMTKVMRGDGGVCVARTAPFFGRPHVPRSECEANARLIAAAPLLLEAVREAIGVLELANQYGLYEPGSLGDADVTDGRDQLRAAHFAATGKYLTPVEIHLGGDENWARQQYGPPAPPPQGVNATGAEAFPDNHLNEGD